MPWSVRIKMDRRLFLTIASSGIFVPKYDRWFKLWSGLLVKKPITATEIMYRDLLLHESLRINFYSTYYNTEKEYTKLSIIQ